MTAVAHRPALANPTLANPTLANPELANPALESPTLRALASEHGLRKVGGRPPLATYVRDLWQRRHFTVELARGMSDSSDHGQRLGALWKLLTPLMWAALYLLIFGVIVGTKGGTENFVGYLVVGLFMFRFVSGCLGQGAECLRRNRTLITTLQFPRVLVPMAATLAELLTLGPAVLVMVALAIVSHEPLRWQMLLLVPAIGLMFTFSLGLTMIAARVVHTAPDLTNLIPFVTRFLMYVSGIFFSIDHFAGHGWLGSLLTYQPVAIFIELARSALLEEVSARPFAWLCAIAWAAVTFGAGFLFFWQAEARYGRG